MTGATYLAPHYGPFNAKLRGHLPLVVPADPAPVLVVAGQNVTWTEGRTIVFDDTYEHEVRDLSSKSFAIPLGKYYFQVIHQSNGIRISVMFDINHPDLTEDRLRLWRARLKVVGKSGSGPLYRPDYTANVLWKPDYSAKVTMEKGGKNEL